MLINEARKPENKEYLARYNAWYDDEWKRQGTIIGQLEHHAITYLMTANGGSATAVIAFVGTSGLMHISTHVTLALFVIGLILCGVSIAIGYHCMLKIQGGLNTDFDSFNSGTMDSTDLAPRNNARHNKTKYGYIAAWASFICLIFGMMTAIWAYFEYKRSKGNRESKAS